MSLVASCSGSSECPLLGHDLENPHPTELVDESASTAVTKDHGPGGLNWQEKVTVL